MNGAIRPRSERGERGAAMVELALVATVLLTMVLGVFEIGMAWRDHQSITQASRAGARVGSQLGTSGATDNQVLRAVQASLGSQAGDLKRVVIYEADANGDMPTACRTATAGFSGAANCNVYDATSLAQLNGTGWGSGGSCGTHDGNWCAATDRDDSQGSATYLGVAVEVERHFLTGLFGGGTHTMTEHTVMRIEPAQ